MMFLLVMAISIAMLFPSLPPEGITAIFFNYCWAISGEYRPRIGWPPSGVSHIAGRSQRFLHLHSWATWILPWIFLGISGFHRKQMEVFTQVMGAPQFSSLHFKMDFPIVFPSSFYWAHHSKGHLHSWWCSWDFPAKFHRKTKGEADDHQLWGKAGWLSEPGGPLVMTNSLRTRKDPPCY